ncbi:MAG: serpin family protein, partial [Anaerolineales bacterium]
MPILSQAEAFSRNLFTTPSFPKKEIAMKRLLHLVLLFVLIGCASGSAYAVSKLPRQSISLPAKQLAPLRQGEANFAFDLYHALPSGENLIFSPYSIYLAFGMVYAGAREQTAQEIASTLHYPEDPHPALNALSSDLERRAQATSEKEKGAFQLHITNALWGQKGYAFRAEYLDLLAKHYGTGVHLVDFQGAADASRQEINRWVAQQTGNRIREIVPPGAITPLTRLVL